MEKKDGHENIPLLKNPLPNSVSDPRFNPDNSLSSRVGESLPSVTNTEIKPNLSRFPDDFDDLTDSNLDTKSPLIISTSTSEQTSIPDNNNQPTENTKNQTEKSEDKPILSRFTADIWKEYEEQQANDEKTSSSVGIPSSDSSNFSSASINNIYVREFVPKSADDPIFPVLRDLFIRSFDEFYKQIERELQLKSDKNLQEWLDETFEEEQQAIVSKKYRCFLLCGNQYKNPNEIILGFLTLKEEDEGSVYVAQVAIHLGIKRRGYGAQLIQHLRNIYPANTYYWGLCRRANRPAVQFYLKQGAKFMANDEVATKYKYDPALYAGFEFTDIAPPIVSADTARGKLKQGTKNSDQQSSTITTITTNNPITTTTGTQQTPAPPKKKRKKIVACCVLS